LAWTAITFSRERRKAANSGESTARRPLERFFHAVRLKDSMGLAEKALLCADFARQEGGKAGQQHGVTTERQGRPCR
jgi:hypothetical protein